MKVIEKDGGILLKDVMDFRVNQIFDCGQAFRFRPISEGQYEGVALGKYLRVKHIEKDVFLWPCTLKTFHDTWEVYFDLRTDYTQIKEQISKDFDIMKHAVAFGSGIRILKQDPWEIIISFIISANNNIPRIQSSIEKISQQYGDAFIAKNGKTYYAFPTPEQLSKAKVEDLRACGVGYRDKYILKSARMIASGDINIRNIQTLSILEATKELTKLHGVGKKVADCILLFGFNHMSAFPVDTWVKKVIAKYFLDETASIKDISQFADEAFGVFGGYAQQYLFFYIRENS